MANLEILLPQNLKQSNKPSAFGFIILSFIGFIDAAYLTVSYYLSSPPPCSLIEGCEKVLTSSYASVGAIPVALFGAVYYLTIFFLALFYTGNLNLHIMRFVSLLTLTGLLATGVLMYLQLFVINAVCIFCLISAGTSIGLAALGARYLLSTDRSKKDL